METLPIVRYSTLAEAVAAAGIDLSYNESRAKEDIQFIENFPTFRGAMVSGNRLFWVNETHDHGRILCEFTPFANCLSDSPLRVCVVSLGMLMITDAKISKRDMRYRREICEKSEVIYLM